jgi:serine/threonine protein kinase
VSERYRKGDTVGPYSLQERLGRGGNGEVWRATREGGEDVALKLITRAGREARIRFDREIETQIGALRDMSGLLPVVDAYNSEGNGGTPWLAMSIATPLKTALGADPPIDTVLECVAQLAEVLADLHARGFAHRDIKPGNLYRYGDSWAIGDLGLIDLPESTPLTVGRRALGPRYFLAPEMLESPEGSDGSAADVYSLAKTLWILMRGNELPPPGTHHHEIPALRPSTYVSHPRAVFLDRLMERATAHDPAARPSAAEMANELRLIMSGSFSENLDIPNVASLRQELSAISDSVRRDANRNRRRIDAANGLFSSLIAAGVETVRLLDEAGAPLDQKMFSGGNETILDRASNLVLAPPSVFQKGACIVTSLPYNTGMAGGNSQNTLFLWSGFGMLANVHDDAGLVAAHVLANSVIWMDSKLVKLESMEAEQAVADLAMGLAAHAIESLAMFLKEYKRVTT